MEETMNSQAEQPVVEAEVMSAEEAADRGLAEAPAAPEAPEVAPEATPEAAPEAAA